MGLRVRMVPNLPVGSVGLVWQNGGERERTK